MEGRADERAGDLGDGRREGGPAFTHISYDGFRVIRANLLYGADKSIEGRPVSYTVHTNPQLVGEKVRDRGAG